MFLASAIFTLLMLGLGVVVPGIDNAAHGGGLVGGAILGCVAMRAWTKSSPSHRQSALGAGAVLLIGLSALTLSIQPPIYRLGDETRVREAIEQFVASEKVISQHWDNLIHSEKRGGLSFDQLAGDIDHQVAAPYRHSFEQLAEAIPSAYAPSTNTLLALQAYANLRGAAASELAEGLRARDAEKIRQAMELARNASANTIVHQPANVPAAR
jgi:rhomboid protease GluP